jgi:hypothetical protein
MALATALFAVPALAQQETPAPGADTLALCTTWRLTTQAVKLANEVNATATERADRARKLVAECKARQCPREEQLNAEQEVREAGYQQVRAAELAAAMEQRRSGLLTRFEELQGKDAVEKCEVVPRQ